MTAEVITWKPRTQPARGAGALTAVAFAASVVMLFIYSQAWIAPLFGEQIDPEASGAVRAFYFPAYAMGLFVLALRPKSAWGGVVRQPFLVLILIIVACSIAWSVAPDQTIRRTVALVATTATAVGLGARWRWPALAEVIGAAYAIVAIGSLLVGLFDPAMGRMSETFPGAWRGLYFEKNAFGGEMAFAFLAFVAAAYLKPRRAKFWGAMAIIAFALILLSTSKTSLVAVVLGLAVAGLVLMLRRGGSLAVLGAYCGVVGLTALAAGIWLAPDVFLGWLGKDATLTGRTKIWTAVLRQISLRPWLGYGYGAVWTEDTSWGPLAWIVKEAGFKPDHAHNSWLEQWLGMGYWGLAAWALYYATTAFRALWAMFTSRGALLAAPFLVVYSLITLTESVAVSYNDLRWVMFVAISIRLALPQRAEG